MVFALIVIFILTIILILLTSISTLLNSKNTSNVNNILKNLIDGPYTNVIYICIFIGLYILNSWEVSLILLILVIYTTYKQDYVWANFFEYNIIAMPLTLRRNSINRLLSEGSIITHWTFHIYLYDILKGNYQDLCSMIKSSILDIKVVLYMTEPSDNFSELWKKAELYQKSFFKFTKIKTGQEERDFILSQDAFELRNLVKSLYDVKKTFSFLRRLPWRFNYKENNNFFFKFVISNILVLYNFLKTTIIALILGFVYFLYTIFFFKIQFLKQVSVWFVIGMMYFWLMSGFNFFLKRYQYGKFTSQIQRFWKRTNTYFWLIEGFLLLLFFYYYLNSSQEPLYMYDYSALNQEYLVSLHTAGLNIILISIIVYFMYFILIRINSNSWTQLSLYLILVSSFIFFSFFLETYQFYYVISTFNERLWVFNEEENLWTIDVDNPILRTKHQYLLVCLIAKYWHFLFIFLSWVFFLIKSFERKKVTYVLFGANLQNIIILYALNFACYLQWFKWIYRRFFDLPYTWFFTNIDNKFFFKFFFEINLLISNLLNNNINPESIEMVVYKSLFLWNVDSLVIWKFI